MEFVSVWLKHLIELNYFFNKKMENICTNIHMYIFFYLLKILFDFFFLITAAIFSDL